MRSPAFTRVVPLLAAALILLGAAVLGVLQVRWVRAASAAEEGRQRLAISRGAFQVVSASADEGRVLLSVSRINGADFAAGNWKQITSELDLWHRNTRFPQLLRGLYIIRSVRSGSALAYAPSDGRFANLPIPADVRDATSKALSTRQPGGGWPSVELGEWRRVVVFPSGSAGSLGAVVLDLDEGAIYRTVVPYYMAQYLPEYPYRVVTASGAVVSAAGLIKQGDLPRPWSASGGWTGRRARAPGPLQLRERREMRTPTSLTRFCNPGFSGRKERAPHPPAPRIAASLKRRSLFRSSTPT